MRPIARLGTFLIVVALALALSSPAFAVAQRWGYQGNVGGLPKTGDWRHRAECGNDNDCTLTGDNMTGLNGKGFMASSVYARIGDDPCPGGGMGCTFFTGQSDVMFIATNTPTDGFIFINLNDSVTGGTWQCDTGNPPPTTDENPIPLTGGTGITSTTYTSILKHWGDAIQPLLQPTGNYGDTVKSRIAITFQHEPMAPSSCSAPKCQLTGSVGLPPSCPSADFTAAHYISAFASVESTINTEIQNGPDGMPGTGDDLAAGYQLPRWEYTATGASFCSGACGNGTAAAWYPGNAAQVDLIGGDIYDGGDANSTIKDRYDAMKTFASNNGNKKFAISEMGDDRTGGGRDLRLNNFANDAKNDGNLVYLLWNPKDTFGLSRTSDGHPNFGNQPYLAWKTQAPNFGLATCPTHC